MQTVLIAHGVFAAFGYGFGDIDALARINFWWLTVRIMGAVGMWSICNPFSTTYHETSCLCRAGLLCIPNLHIVKVTNHPNIHHMCELLLCSFAVVDP